MGCASSAPPSSPTPGSLAVRPSVPTAGEEKAAFVFKLLVVGDSGTGKSCLMQRFADPDAPFSDAYASTIGVDFKVRTVSVCGQRVKLQIWDTAGQERFRSITGTYYRGCQGVLVAFDVSNQKSFESVERWMEEVEALAGPSVEKVLVGTKCDLQFSRQVLKKTAADLAANLKIQYIETSAKDAEGVEEAFQKLAENILGNMDL